MDTNPAYDTTAVAANELAGYISEVIALAIDDGNTIRERAGVVIATGRTGVAKQLVLTHDGVLTWRPMPAVGREGVDELAERLSLRWVS